MGEIQNKMSAVALSLATSALLLIESRKRINFTTETFAHFKFAISDESSIVEPRSIEMMFGSRNGVKRNP